MNILYVAARYHTNQIPIMSGWLKEGEQVTFISQYRGKSEDYRVLSPIVLGYSKIFKILLKIYQVAKRNTLKESALPNLFEAKYGFPPIGTTGKIIKKYRPDVVILRDYSVYNLFFCKKCRRVPCIMYTQSPLYETRIEETGFVHRLFKRMFPSVRITPVLGDEKLGNKTSEHAYFVPFVINPYARSDVRSYFKDDIIHILCIGKYEKRKNQLMLIKALQSIPVDNWRLTIIGEATTESHLKYKKTVEQYLQENNLLDRVELLTNLELGQVYEYYMKSDVFVLPSTREFASISQLEAMACGLPVICSDTNGSSCYIADGYNGYLFTDNSQKDLQSKIALLLNSKEQIMTMGKNSLTMIQENNSFTQYETKIKNILKEEFI